MLCYIAVKLTLIGDQMRSAENTEIIKITKDHTRSCEDLMTSDSLSSNPI